MLTLCGVNVNIVCMTKWIPTLQRGKGPAYRILADALEQDIASGRLAPGDKLPTHRELADNLNLNVSTVTKGYAEAEKRGLVAGTVGRGTFVASDAAAATSIVSFEQINPGTIEMGFITPLYDLDPDLGEALKRLARRKSSGAYLEYSDPRGLPEHRNAGAFWAQKYGLETSPDSIIVCAGGQHALTCCFSSLFNAGERIAIDCLSYPGAKSLAGMLGLRLAPIGMDEQGMIPEKLDRACRREQIRGLYLMPGVHNPTTATMSRERREKLARVALRHELAIIEDDAYDLTSPGLLPPVAAVAPENTVYIAGVSKALAPGLRVAFLSAPDRFRKNLSRAVLNTVWMAPSLNVELACMWIKDGTAEHTIKAKRAEAKKRFGLARELLREHDFNGLPTGFFIWLRLPGQWTGQNFEAAAREAGVNVLGAERFVVGDAPAPAAARVSLAGTASRAELRKGLSIIADLLSDRLPEPVMF